jgi:hypothetical protein
MANSAVHSIQGVARRCDQKITAIAAQKDYPHSIRTWAELQATRLQIWTATLGVHARGRMSIAYRLRLNVSMSSMILQLLIGIEGCLDVLLQRTQVQAADTKMHITHKLMRRLQLRRDSDPAESAEQDWRR